MAERLPRRAGGGGVGSAASSPPDLWMASYRVDFDSDTTADWTTAVVQASTVGTPDITPATDGFHSPGGVLVVSLNLETSSGNPYPEGAQVACGISATNGTVTLGNQWDAGGGAGSESGYGQGQVAQAFVLNPAQAPWQVQLQLALDGFTDPIGLSAYVTLTKVNEAPNS